MANFTATALNTLSMQAALERQYMEHSRRMEGEMLLRQNGFDPYLQALPPLPPVSGLRKRNKRLLLCQP